MAGMLGKLRELLSITEPLKPPEGAQRVCDNCSFWLRPAGLTLELTKSQRALDWARQGGYGCCRAPKAKSAAESGDGKDGQRFTLPQARCKQWSWHGKAWNALPQAAMRAARPSPRRN